MPLSAPTPGTWQPQSFSISDKSSSPVEAIKVIKDPKDLKELKDFLKKTILSSY